MPPLPPVVVGGSAEQGLAYLRRGDWWYQPFEVVESSGYDLTRRGKRHHYWSTSCRYGGGGCPSDGSAAAAGDGGATRGGRGLGRGLFRTLRALLPRVRGGAGGP